jgi:AAA family ATP:ADP antiporter
MGTDRAGLLGRLSAVHEDERGPVAWALALFFCVLTSYMILRPVRDAMGIAAGVENLKWLFTATFFAMLVVVPAYSGLVAKLGRKRFVPIVYHFFAASLVLFFALLDVVPNDARPRVAQAFYVWISVYNLFVVSVFWGLMADLFSHEQGRRLFGVIAVGGSAGALVGPTLTALLVTRIGVPGLLLLSLVALELGVFCLFRLMRSRSQGLVTESAGEDEEPLGGGILDGVGRLLTSPYLTGIAGFVELLSLAGTFLYFEQANLVKASIEGDAERTALFARMDLVVNVLGALGQAFVVHRLIRWIGLGKTLMLLPLVTAVGFVALGIRFELATLVVVMVLHRGTTFGIAVPAREVLFTVAPRQDKYKAKAFIDTVVVRGGDVTFGWLFAALVGVGLALPTVALVAAPAAAAWAWLGYGLGRAAESRSDNGSGSAGARE